MASWTAATVGYSVYAISIVWLAYTVSHSFLVVGAALFIELAVYTLVFLAGPIADRIGNQRTIYVACYPVMGVAAALIGVAHLEGFLTVPLLLGLIAVISILWDIAWAAGNAAPGLLLTADEQFAGQAVSGSIGGANTIAGYAAGGVLILVVGPAGGMLLYGALLGVAAVLALPLRIHPHPAPGQTFWESLGAGWQRIWEEPGKPLLQLASVDGIVGFFTAVPALLITLLATTTFRTSAAAYSSLFVSYVVGGTIAGLALGRWNPRSRVGILLVGFVLAVAGVFALVIVVPPILALEVGVLLGVGFLSTAYLDVKYAFFRGRFARGEQGRLISNMYLFPGLASSAGALVLGSLSDSVSAPELAAVAASGFLAAGLVGLVLPGVRRFRF
jgi:MFS family permease